MKQLILVLFAAFAVGSLSLAGAQSFEVASVRINRAGSTGGEGKTDGSITATRGNLTMTNLTLASCIQWAYEIREFQISGGPAWISSERYDISAKAAGPVGDGEMRKMLQAILVERFHLRLRHEVRPLPVYALTVNANHNALRTAGGDEPTGMRPGEGVLEFRNISMSDFSERLARRPISVDRPVVDKTGLTGGYDFELRFANSAAGLKSALEDIDRGTGQSIFTVLREQLGLRLESQREPLPVLVVESVSENPTEN